MAYWSTDPATPKERATASRGATPGSAQSARQSAYAADGDAALARAGTERLRITLRQVVVCHGLAGDGDSNRRRKDVAGAPPDG